MMRKIDLLVLKVETGMDFSKSIEELSVQEEEQQPVELEPIQEIPRRSNRVNAGRLPRHFEDFEMVSDIPGSNDYWREFQFS